MNSLHHIKLKSSLKYKIILNYTILYLVAPKVTGFKFTKNPKNKQINS